ncbi:leucine-rich repeat-containing protein 71-like isoform X3 [Asterias rubens]|uniref:leucine-rich repeat-containing protein 71-like isoform X3 n=1 Tax=Asterias rubens TaxID=7604 RepID=UPI0014559EB7|nr:leucine-rich repeat-containing protein 71-like isoform X3 [Asterias rubens]
MPEGVDDSPANARFASIAKKVKMGKRTEKALKEKAAASTSQEASEDDVNKVPEPYTCTGHFDPDFTELCRRAGLAPSEIPNVVIRAKRPGTPPPPDPKAKDPNPPEEAVDVAEEEPKPKTYVTKERFAYFKPCIQVEMENEDKPATVTEVYIRGWKIDDMMVGIFKTCFPTIEKLHTINFWNTGLTDKTLRDLAAIFPQCPNLKNIVIEGNPIPEEPWACIMGEDSLIINLSLRHNDITDRGASGISSALSTVTTCNKNLISLNLSHNKITDVGAEAIAKGLRMNRILLCLSLASNRITDKGAMKFGELLSRFPLTHEEVVERRKLLRDKGSPDRGSGKSPPPSRRAESKDRPGSVRSGSHLDKGDKKRDKSSKKKDNKHEKKNDKEDDKKGNKTVAIMDNKKDKDDGKGGTKKADTWKKGGSRSSVTVAITETVTKTTKGKKTTSSKDKKGGAMPESESPDMVEAINPLLESVESIEGQLWIPGNRSIISLNLSRNEIGEAGLKSILLAVQYQITLANLAPNPALKGLMRLSLGRNPIRADSEAYQKIQDLMLTRDPFYKAQAKSPDGDTQSLAG